MRRGEVWLWSFLFLRLGLSGPAWGEDTTQYYDTQVYKDLSEQDAHYKERAQCGYLGIRCPDGSPGYYTFAYITDGIASIYEATGSEYYLQRLIEYSRLIMAQGVDDNGDGYHDYFHWMKDRPDYCKWDYEHHYARACYWNAMRSVARCARVGKLGPHYSKYKADIDEIIAFIDKQVIEKWEKGDQSMTLEQCIAQTHFTINGVASHAGSFLVDAYLATGNAHYRDLATRFAEKVKAAWVLYSNGSYAWSADGGILVPTDYMGTQYQMQDTSHAIRVIRFAVIAYRAGIVVTDTDIACLVNTFNKNIWRGETGKFSAYVNGAGESGAGITQWVRLGAFDTTAHNRLVTWTGGGRSPAKYASDRIHYYGILALNLKLRAEGET